MSATYVAIHPLAEPELGTEPLLWLCLVLYCVLVTVLNLRESLFVDLVTLTCAWFVDNTNNFLALDGGIFNFRIPVQCCPLIINFTCCTEL